MNQRLTPDCRNIYVFLLAMQIRGAEKRVIIRERERIKQRIRPHYRSINIYIYFSYADTEAAKRIINRERERIKQRIKPHFPQH